MFNKQNYRKDEKIKKASFWKPFFNYVDNKDYFKILNFSVIKLSPTININASTYLQIKSLLEFQLI